MPLIFVPQNFHIYKRSGHKFPRFSGGLKHQLPSLVDLFDQCFPHTTGEGLQLWLFSLIELFGGWENPNNLLCLAIFYKKNPCEAYYPPPPPPNWRDYFHLLGAIQIDLIEKMIFPTNQKFRDRDYLLPCETATTMLQTKTRSRQVVWKSSLFAVLCPCHSHLPWRMCVSSFVEATAPTYHVIRKRMQA